MSDTQSPTAEYKGAQGGPPPTVLLYDADGEQRFSFQTERRGALYTVTHIFGPIKDEPLIDLDRARDQRLGEADASETNDSQAVAVSSNAGASLHVDYWGKTGARAEGYANKVSAKDKVYAVINLLLATRVKATPTVIGEGLCPEEDEEEVVDYTLRCLFSGTLVELKHTLREGEKDFEAYQSIMSRALLVEGMQFGQTEQRIPSRWLRLGHLYDRMKVSAEGYAGRVPLHHKVALILHHFRSKQKALAGNSNALPPQ